MGIEEMMLNNTSLPAKQFGQLSRPQMTKLGSCIWRPHLERERVDMVYGIQGHYTSRIGEDFGKNQEILVKRVPEIEV